MTGTKSSTMNCLLLMMFYNMKIIVKWLFKVDLGQSRENSEEYKQELTWNFILYSYRHCECFCVNHLADKVVCCKWKFERAASRSGWRDSLWCVFMGWEHWNRFLYLPVLGFLRIFKFSQFFLEKVSKKNHPNCHNFIYVGWERYFLNFQQYFQKFLLFLILQSLFRYNSQIKVGKTL
jgi:hypothetical protein